MRRERQQASESTTARAEMPGWPRVAESERERERAERDALDETREEDARVWDSGPLSWRSRGPGAGKATQHTGYGLASGKRVSLGPG